MKFIISSQEVSMGVEDKPTLDMYQPVYCTCDRIYGKVPFSHTKLDPFFWILKHHTFFDHGI